MIGATCMLSSCGIYSTYKPQTSVPENLYGEEFLAKDTVSLGNLEWRELFKDPQLQALIERGLQNNTDLRTAQLRVEEAKAALLAAKLSFIRFRFRLVGNWISLENCVMPRNRLRRLMNRVKITSRLFIPV